MTLLGDSLEQSKNIRHISWPTVVSATCGATISDLLMNEVLTVVLAAIMQ